MAKIIRNPAIPDNIRIVEYSEYSRPDAAMHRELMRLYETGWLLILRGYRFRSGRDVFPNVNFPNERRFKKIFLPTSGNPHNDSSREDEWKAVREAIPSEESFKRFQEAVASANTELFSLISSLFPAYAYTKRLCSYSLTETLCHNLHFDSPQHAGVSAQVRAFVNLDAFPRIWGVGESLENVATRNYINAGLAKTKDEDPREFTRALTASSFGSRVDNGLHAAPKHCIAFQPGEVWFLNPNFTAHEVMYGRRLLDGIFLFNETSLLDRSRYYPNVITAIHEKIESELKKSTTQGMFARMKGFMPDFKR